MTFALTIVHIVVSLLLIASIMLQNKGSGLGQAFGGDGAVFSARRGPEKTLFRATVILAVLFVGVSLAVILLPQFIA